MNVVNVVPKRSSEPPARIPHTPVLMAEVLEAFKGVRGVIVDATVGAGGHAAALLEANADIELVAIDRDPTAQALARTKLARFGERVRFARGAFSTLPELLDGLGIDHIDGLLADLGVSSMQLDTPERGMSFRQRGPIDMRMDPDSGRTAEELIVDLDGDDLAELIAKLGDERRARRIARCIKQASEAGELETTHDLRRAVVRAVGPQRAGGIDPATRTFQALRMAVNDELGQLQKLIVESAKRMRTGGRLAIISFHSLEDRIAKRMFRELGAFMPLNKKPIVAGESEVDRNPRARSAKLRVAVRVSPTPTLPPLDGGGFEGKAS